MLAKPSIKHHYQCCNFSVVLIAKEANVPLWPLENKNHEFNIQQNKTWWNQSSEQMSTQVMFQTTKTQKERNNSERTVRTREAAKPLAADVIQSKMKADFVSYVCVCIYLDSIYVSNFLIYNNFAF